MAKISPDIISFCGQIGLMMLSSHLVPNIRHIERNGMNTQLELPKTLLARILGLFQRAKKLPAGKRPLIESKEKSLGKDNLRREKE